MRPILTLAGLLVLGLMPPMTDPALAQGFKPEHPAQSLKRAWLVTPEEAARKAPRTRALVVAKSDPGGPRLVIQSPGAIKVVKAPVTIDVAFTPQDGAAIDLATLKVTYLALFNVDITDRLAPYLTSAGIHADQAELPTGEHDIEISVKDTRGRKSVERLSFKVIE